MFVTSRFAHCLIVDSIHIMFCVLEMDCLACVSWFLRIWAGALGKLRASPFNMAEWTYSLPRGLRRLRIGRCHLYLLESALQWEGLFFDSNANADQCQDVFLHECAPRFDHTLFQRFLGHVYDVHLIKAEDRRKSRELKWTLDVQDFKIIILPRIHSCFGRSFILIYSHVLAKRLAG